MGRGDELSHISTLLLGTTPMITITGPGGIGKTRLAAETAHRIRAAGRRPLYWVRLAGLLPDCDPIVVAEEVARGVVDSDMSGLSAPEALIAALSRAGAHSLLVLDNCEHALPGTRELVATLLDEVAGLTVLATSREPIGGDHEQLVKLPPLPRSDAAELFRQRAEVAGHRLDTADEAAVDRICRHIDDNPLFIRLAAARLSREPLAMVADGLSGDADDRRLRWRHGPGVGNDSRHRGVRDVIAWSYGLCTPAERLLLERMSVFSAGTETNPDNGASDCARYIGADPEAIAAICADSELSADRVPELLARLVDQSLVSVHMTTTEVRYSLVESVRVFAHQQLRNRGAAGRDEPERLARRHRHHYRDAVLAAAAAPPGPGDLIALNWAQAAWDNMRLAIETSIATPGEATIGLDITTGLIALRVPFVRGSLRELQRWAELAMRAEHEVGSAAGPRVQALALIAWSMLCQGLLVRAEEVLTECLTRCLRDAETARRWRAHAETDRGLPAAVEFAQGAALMIIDHDPRAVAVLARAHEKYIDAGDVRSASNAEFFAAMAAGSLDTPQRALRIARRHRDRTLRFGADWSIAWAELAWATAAGKQGRIAEALSAARSALTRMVAIQDRWGVLWSVHVRIWTLAQQLATSGDTEPADRRRTLAIETARLAGGAEALRDRLGAGHGTDLQLFEIERALMVARTVLGDRTVATAQHEGAQLRCDRGEVERFALGTLDPDTAPWAPIAPAPLPWTTLTTAERAVAILAAAGWTNSAIAARRGRSLRTVDAQVSAIFQKLEINSRADILGFAPDAATAPIERERQRLQRAGTGRAIPD